MSYCGFSVHAPSVLWLDLLDTQDKEGRAERLRHIGYEEARIVAAVGGNCLRVFYCLSDICSTLSELPLGLDILPAGLFDGAWHLLEREKKLAVVSRVADFVWKLADKVNALPSNGDGLFFDDLDSYLGGIQLFNEASNSGPRVRVLLTNVSLPPRPIIEAPANQELNFAGLPFTFEDLYGRYCEITIAVARRLVRRYTPSDSGKESLIVAFEINNEPDYEWLPDELRIEKSENREASPVEKYITELFQPQIPSESACHRYAERTPWNGFQEQSGNWSSARSSLVSMLEYDWGPKYDWYLKCYGTFAKHFSFAITDEGRHLGRTFEIISAGVTHNNIDFLIRLHRIEPEAFSFCTAIAFHPYHWPEHNIHDTRFRDRRDYSDWESQPPRTFASHYFKCFDFFKTILALPGEAAAMISGKKIWLTEFGIGTKLYGEYNATGWKFVPFTRPRRMPPDALPKESAVWEDIWEQFFNQVPPEFLKQLGVQGMFFYTLREASGPGLDKHDDDRTNFALIRRNGLPRMNTATFTRLQQFMQGFTGVAGTDAVPFKLTSSWTRWRDHSTTLLRSEPWKTTPCPESVLKCLSMLSAEEKTFLYWTTKEYFAGKGAIIDAGCFVGGSTVAFAAGLEEVWPEPQYTIDSFDIFVADEYMRTWYFDPQGLQTEGPRFRNIFDMNTAAFRHRLRVHDGDIAAAHFDDRPVEILFLDICKSWATNDYCARTFFPRLIPGRSLVIQQDFFHNWEFWIAILMELFWDRFDYIGFVPHNTAVFRLKAAIRADEIPQLRSLGFERLEELMIRQAERYDGYQKAMLLTALAGLYLEFERRNLAEAAASRASALCPHFLVTEARKQMAI
jgi:hypothetical protein